MEIFGGFMVMMSIIGMFLAVVWLVMPFVVFAIKGKQEHTLERLEELKKQLDGIEARLEKIQSAQLVNSAPLASQQTVTLQQAEEVVSE